MESGVDSMRLSVRTEVQVEEARWRSSAEVVGRGMPMPDDLTGRERGSKFRGDSGGGGPPYEGRKESGAESSFNGCKVG